MKTIECRALLDYKLYIRTPYGEQYHIHENGNIERLDMKGFVSGQWKFLGLHHVRRNEFIPLQSLTRKVIEGLTLQFKNGKPQYTVIDLDHGTRRMWGNTAVHGISDLRILTKGE